MDLWRKKEKTNKNKRVKLVPRLMWDLQYPLQPRPQGFSLKKWVGREKPWGRGCILYSKYLLPISNDGVSVRSGRTGYLRMADGDR